MEKQEAKSKLQERKMSGRLLVFPLPFQGHISPMLQLANILHSRGFNITIIHTFCNSPNKSNYPHFAFETISEDSLTGFPTISGSVTNVVLLNKVCVDPFHDCMKRLLTNSSADDPILCLITDALLYFTRAVADLLKLPRIVLRTSSLSAFHVLYLRPILLQKGYLSLEDSNSEAPVPEVQPLKVKDISRTYKIEGEDLDEIISGMTTGTKAASAIIWNTFEELEQSVLPTIQQNFPIPSFTIGPFHKYFTASASSLLEQDQTAISWLDTQAPLSVLYVSFGSVALIDKSEFLEMAWALANSKQKFLWVVRPGVIRGSEWLEPFPDGLQEAVSERGHIVKWAPQQEVLAHSATACFWSHCGWNSTLESICEGVPMICSPCFGDQWTNARYVEAVWKVGLVLENGIKREEIERAIRRVMIDEEGKEMKMRMSCLKEKTEFMRVPVPMPMPMPVPIQQPKFPFTDHYQYQMMVRFGHDYVPGALNSMHDAHPSNPLYNYPAMAETGDTMTYWNNLVCEPINNYTESRQPIAQDLMEYHPIRHGSTHQMVASSNQASTHAQFYEDRKG